MANARDLLLNHCDFTSVPEVRSTFCVEGACLRRLQAGDERAAVQSMPRAHVLRSFSMWSQVGEVQEYLDKGPGFIFLFHPALGPLWDVIGQKVRLAAVTVDEPARGPRRGMSRPSAADVTDGVMPADPRRHAGAEGRAGAGGRHCSNHRPHCGRQPAGEALKC